MNMQTKPSAYLPLPFSVRWNHENEAAMRDGGWHVHSAPSQYGKSTSNRAFYLQMKAQKTSDGKTSVPVAQAWATDGKRLILRSIAESLGGERFAALPNRELRVPAGIKQLGTRLIIVNNGHNMEWRQWQELLTLDDVCWAHHGVRPAIVLSGVHRELGLVNLPRIPELVEQIRKRIVCYKEVPGHDRREAKEAMRLLLERECPELLGRGAQDHVRLLYELLTDSVFDRWHTRTVGSADLVEVARRMAALHRAHRDRSAEAVIRSAVERYRKSQTAPDETSAAKLARAARGLQASGAAHA